VYDAGHDLNDVPALIDRAEWLQDKQDKIGIRSVTPLLERKLKRGERAGNAGGSAHHLERSTAGQQRRVPADP
jgi:hypothetical protein